MQYRELPRFLAGGPSHTTCLSCEAHLELQEPEARQTTLHIPLGRTTSHGPTAAELIMDSKAVPGPTNSLTSALQARVVFTMSGPESAANISKSFLERFAE